MKPLVSFVCFSNESRKLPLPKSSLMTQLTQNISYLHYEINKLCELIVFIPDLSFSDWFIFSQLKTNLPQLAFYRLMDKIITEQKEKEKNSKEDTDFNNNAQSYGLNRGRKNILNFCSDKLKCGVIHAIPRMTRRNDGKQSFSKSTTESIVTETA